MRTMVKHVLFGLAFVGSACGAQTKILLGYTPAPDFVAAYVAKEEGVFARHGLDVEMSRIALTSTMPAALLSDSIQMGIAGPASFLQATEGGLDLVAVAGTTVTAPGGNRAGLVARKEAAIAGPKDLIGKKVGVPGLGGTMDVLFRRWLMQRGVNPKQLKIIEVAIPTQSDVLKSGAVDAVVAVEPILTRMVDSGVGVSVAGIDLFGDAPPGQTTAVFATTRKWGLANGPALAAFRAAIAEAADLARKEPEKSRGYIGKYTTMPPPVLAQLKLPLPTEPAISSEQLAWWGALLTQQGMLVKVPNVTRLVTP